MVNVRGKAVLVRGDFDVDDLNNPRTDSVRKMIGYLDHEGAKRVKIIGHQGKYIVRPELEKEFGEIEFFDQLREDPREMENNPEMARELAAGFEVYINEAFATSHRKHTSIVALPILMKAEGKEVSLGLRFTVEMKKLNEFWEKKGKRVLVIGGTKVGDKEKFAEAMRGKFTDILKGGLLPGVKLRPDGLDITDRAIEEYSGKIRTAELILAAGVMGKYEDPEAEKGTRKILEAIAGNSQAYKVAGGGDIERAIDMFGLTEKFDWISVGGGAMLVYLGEGTLVGIEAVK